MDYIDIYSSKGRKRSGKRGETNLHKAKNRQMKGEKKTATIKWIKGCIQKERRKQLKKSHHVESRMDFLEEDTLVEDMPITYPFLAHKVVVDGTLVDSTLDDGILDESTLDEGTLVEDTLVDETIVDNDQFDDYCEAYLKTHRKEGRGNSGDTALKKAKNHQVKGRKKSATMRWVKETVDKEQRKRGKQSHRNNSLKYTEV